MQVLQHQQAAAVLADQCEQPQYGFTEYDGRRRHVVRRTVVPVGNKPAEHLPVRAEAFGGRHLAAADE